MEVDFFFQAFFLCSKLNREWHGIYSCSSKCMGNSNETSREGTVDYENDDAACLIAKKLESSPLCLCIHLSLSLSPTRCVSTNIRGHLDLWVCSQRIACDLLWFLVFAIFIVVCAFFSYFEFDKHENYHWPDLFLTNQGPNIQSGPSHIRCSQNNSRKNEIGQDKTFSAYQISCIDWFLFSWLSQNV